MSGNLILSNPWPLGWRYGVAFGLLGAAVAASTLLCAVGARLTRVSR